MCCFVMIHDSREASPHQPPSHKPQAQATNKRQVSERATSDGGKCSKIRLPLPAIPIYYPPPRSPSSLLRPPASSALRSLLLKSTTDDITHTRNITHSNHGKRTAISLFKGRRQTSYSYQTQNGYACEKRQGICCNGLSRTAVVFKQIGTEWLSKSSIR